MLKIIKRGVVQLVPKPPKLGSRVSAPAATCEDMVKVQQALLPQFKGLDVTLAAGDMHKIQRALLASNVPFFRRGVV